MPLSPTYLRLATECPGPQIPSDVQNPNASDPAPKVAEKFLQGEEIDFRRKLNKLELLTEMLGRCGGGGIAVVSGGLTDPALGFKIRVAAGTQIMDDLSLVVPIDTDVVCAAGSWFIWWNRAGAPKTTSTATLNAPAGDPACFLGRVTFDDAGNLTELDEAGVFRKPPGGPIMRRTGDAAAPADTPPASTAFYQVSTGGLYFWDGTAYRGNWGGQYYTDASDTTPGFAVGKDRPGQGLRTTISNPAGNEYRTWDGIAPTPGHLSLSVAGGANVTVSTTEPDAAADNGIQEYTGLLTASINVILPKVNSRLYLIYNNTTGNDGATPPVPWTLTVKGSTGTGVAVPQGQRQWVYFDGTNYVPAGAAFGGAGPVALSDHKFALDPADNTAGGSDYFLNKVVPADDDVTFNVTTDVTGRKTAGLDVFPPERVLPQIGLLLTPGVAYKLRLDFGNIGSFPNGEFNLRFKVQKADPTQPAFQFTVVRDVSWVETDDDPTHVCYAEIQLMGGANPSVSGVPNLYLTPYVSWFDWVPGAGGALLFEYHELDPAGVGGSAPAAPSGLTVGSPTATTLTAAWTDNSLNEDGFKLERSADGGVTWGQVWDSAAPNVVSRVDPGLTPSTTYAYRVRAYNAFGNSAYSNVASGTTSAGSSGPQYVSPLLAGGGSGTLAVARNVAAGHTLVVCVGYNWPGTVSVTDDAGNVYSLVDSATGSSTHLVAQYASVLANPLTAGQHVIVTVTGHADAVAVAVLEFTALTATADVMTNADGAGSPADSGPLATTHAADALVAAFAAENSNTGPFSGTPNAGWTLVTPSSGEGGGITSGDPWNPTGDGIVLWVSYRIVTMTGIYEPTLDFSPNWMSWAAVAVAYEG